MTEKVLLSILIPSVPSRFKQMKELYDRIDRLSQGHSVEILVFIDNKKRSIL